MFWLESAIQLWALHWHVYIAQTAAAENQIKAFKYIFHFVSLRESKGRFINVGFLLRESKAKSANASLNWYDDRPAVWSLAFGSQTFHPMSRWQSISCSVSSLVDLAWIAGAFMQLSTLYVIKKAGLLPPSTGIEDPARFNLKLWFHSPFEHWVWACSQLSLST